jgi:hypothetical protein
MKKLAEQGQELPPELLASLIKQGSANSPLSVTRSRWLVSITLASLAIGLGFWAFMIEDSMDGAKLMLMIALVFAAGAIGTAMLALAEQRSPK